MFDIDGTLVDSMGFDVELYVRAIRAELGADVPIDETWRSYRNVTDSGVLDEILARHDGDRPADELRQRVKARFVALVADHLERNRHAVREIPGATALVATLLATPGARVAIATGGWAETANMKLRAIGLDADALAIATSSDALERTRIMQIAEQRALAGAAPSRRTYLGDAWWDKRASAELGFSFVAIGKTVVHEPRFDDYSDRGAVLACLLGEAGSAASG
jgi:phosphoglycolate phosphatase-like HAD superfamily hydrolase